MNDINSLAECGGKELIRPKVDTLTGLKAKRDNLQTRLNEIDKAIKFLESNPTFTQGLDMVLNVARY